MPEDAEAEDWPDVFLAPVGVEAEDWPDVLLATGGLGETTDFRLVAGLVRLTTLDAASDFRSCKDLHGPKTSDAASRESLRAGLEWSAEAATASEEARAPSAV